MEITKQLDGTLLRVTLVGRLDTVTSQQLTTDLVEIEQASAVEFDFSKLEYISSAGLRVLVAYQKKLGGKDKVIIHNANAIVKNVFSVTGIGNLLTVD